MALTRRTLLKLSVAAGVAVAGPMVTTRVAGQTGRAQEVEGKEKWVPSVCLQCPAGCGILVRVVDGRAVKIEGNPLYPSNRGKTCPKGQMGLQILYDPDRIKGPMRRAGERGSGRWERISWDEAIGFVASKLRELRARGEPHTLVFMGGRYRGHMGGLVARFLEAYGSPNDVGHSSICEDGSPMGHWLTQGWKAYAAYDWDNCDYLISFGAGFIEAWRPTARLLRAYGHMRRGRLGLRAKIVQVEPRFSVTAAKADEWVPINPGTDGALALGIAHVIVREGLYNRKFIDERTFGFERWTDEHGHQHVGFREFVLANYPPEKAEKITGVPARTIERIAREFASKQPHCIAAGARGSSMQSNGVYNRFAIHILNALVGSIEARGGVLRQIDPPFTAWPDVVKDDVGQKGWASPRIDYAGTARYPLAGKVYQDIPDRILQEDPYPVKILACYYTNPMFSSPDTGRWYKALQKVPLVVTFSPFMDETSAYADLILPDHTYLERWQDDIIYPSMGYPVWGIRQPAVKPLYDTMNSGDVIIKLAHAIGGSVARSFPWKDFLGVIKFRAQGVFEAGKGNIVAASFDDWWNEFLRLGVWTAPPYPYASETPDQWKRTLATPSGKFEFFSQGLSRKLEHLAEDEARRRGTAPEQEMERMLTDLKIGARGDEVFLPHYEPIRFVGDEREYPFVLVTFKTITHAEGRGANVPMAQEHFNVQTWERWTAYAQMNPEAAGQLGIREGEEIWIESPLGRVKTRVLFMPHHPQIVALPFELGHREYGRWAKARGVNPNTIIANEHDRSGGLAAWFSTRVKVYKA